MFPDITYKQSSWLPSALQEDYFCIYLFLLRIVCYFANRMNCFSYKLFFNLLGKVNCALSNWNSY